ncbi:MAG TPA: trypsin-like peptidase domain-containing protein [Steroidobacteraceae bacterium]|nr:trypsin-like peptidase domain-containing protein [Steroidobacteraceae bacterium]
MVAKSWSRGLLFVAGSVVGGLALAFVIVALRPDLIRRDGIAAVPPAAAGSVPATVQSARVTYADAVRRAAPAVVNIYTARVVTERVAPSSLDELFREGWPPRYRQRIENSLGSGVIVDHEGHVVTNHHVIANADAIRVQLADERIADAEIVGRDPDTDLAVLRINLKNLPVAPIGRSDNLHVGDVVLAIGSPVGLTQTVTHGIVSATTRSLGVATFEDFIQTDAAINVGNSGGALIDTSGALVGINTAIIAKNLGVEGIGFAIPVDLVRGVLADIIAHGRVIRGWIGIEPRDVPEYQRQQLGLPANGVLIANLYVGSPAQRAGLQPGDVLTDIDGVPVRSAQEAIARVASHRKPGETIKLRVIRGGRAMELQTQVVEQPRGR